MSKRTDPIEVRFWDKVNKTETCWLWTGSILPTGYGQIRVDRHLWRAHRFAYTFLVGPIPEGLHLDHLCSNRACVRPDHLDPVTQQENNARAPRPVISHCPKGHEYTPENTYRWRGRAKRCRICIAAQARAKYHRKRAAA